MPRSWLRDADIQNGYVLFCFIIMITVKYIKYFFFNKDDKRMAKIVCIVLHKGRKQYKNICDNASQR